MSKLILIKHASPLKDPAKPSRQWRLSEEGRAAAARLAEQLTSMDLQVIVSSDEPKAHETATIIGEKLRVPVETAPDLHEHDRDNVPVMPTREFISSVAQFFKERSRLVLGRETAQQASDRIHRAIESVTQTQSGKNIAIVTHGTVLSLFAADDLKQDPFVLWRRLGLPSFIAMQIPSREIIRVLERV